MRLELPSPDITRPRGDADAGYPHGPKPRHLLLVDDEEQIVVALGRLLARAGFRVTAFSHADEAIEALRESPERFDAVLSDVRMPRHSGLDIAREASHARADLAVLIMSGAPLSEEMSREAEACGVRDVLLKPIRLDRLRESLRGAMAGTPG